MCVANSNFGPGLETAPSFPKLCDECSVSHSGNPAHETYDMEMGFSAQLECIFEMRGTVLSTLVELSIIYFKIVMINIEEISLVKLNLNPLI